MAILLVDDNEITLEVERMLLEANGVTVETATSGARAIELSRNNKYALIIMDVQMPEMDGFAAAKAIREFYAEVPIIALSADDISTDDPAFVNSGMNSALKKPIQIKAIRDLFTEYLNITNNELIKWRRERDSIFEYNEFLELAGSPDSAQRIKGIRASGQFVFGLIS